MPKSSSEPNSKNVDIYPLKTRLAKGVAVVLGDVEEVQKLDRKRCKLKNVLKSKYQIGKQEAIEDYECVLAPVKSKVLAEQRKAKKQLDSWEKAYYKENQKAATYEVMNGDKVASVLLKKLNMPVPYLKSRK